jgi:hypothetical protein
MNISGSPKKMHFTLSDTPTTSKIIPVGSKRIQPNTIAAMFESSNAIATDINKLTLYTFS